ncbi:ASF1 like histone chaperone [Fragilaria crotonensis]|nr:ASF1 like histone chaperone [Fragilaria crotonensis]
MDNPTTFASPFQFEITFECLQELDDDLEWKMLYVGKAADSTQDLILDEILVGPVPVGVNKFVLQADAPDPNQLEELLGVTVVLVTCSYREREFVRVGYYVNNALEGYDPESGQALPSPLDVTKVTRQILADKPRVTKFPIPWGDETEITTATTTTSTTELPQSGMMMSSSHDDAMESDNLVTNSMDQGQEPESEPEMDDVEGEEGDEDDDDEEDEPDGNEGDEVDLEEEDDDE